jgi:hypothetical protein
MWLKIVNTGPIYGGLFTKPGTCSCYALNNLFLGLSPPPVR